MATTSTRTKASSRTVATEADLETVAVEDEPVVTETKPTKEKPIKVKDVDPEEYVTVRNGFQGRLVYRSPRTGETYVWDQYGSEQEMELRELQRAKNTYKTFFANNWFMFDDDWIIDYLGVRNYYKHAIPIDHFDDFFTKKPDELKAEIAELSNGQKRSVAYRARQLISENKIDSRSVIAALEESLGIELIEK